MGTTMHLCQIEVYNSLTKDGFTLQRKLSDLSAFIGLRPVLLWEKLRSVLEIPAPPYGSVYLISLEYVYAEKSGAKYCTHIVVCAEVVEAGVVKGTCTLTLGVEPC